MATYTLSNKAKEDAEGIYDYTNDSCTYCSISALGGKPLANLYFLISSNRAITGHCFQSLTNADCKPVVFKIYPKRIKTGFIV